MRRGYGPRVESADRSKMIKGSSAPGDPIAWRVQPGSYSCDSCYSWSTICDFGSRRSQSHWLFAFSHGWLVSLAIVVGPVQVGLGHGIVREFLEGALEFGGGIAVF